MKYAKREEKMRKGSTDNRRYTKNRPSDCAYCYFWKANKKCCSQPECYYLLSDNISGSKPASQAPELSTISEKTGDCRTCPYGRHSPCIGYCIKKIILEMKQKKQDRKKTEVQ